MSASTGCVLAAVLTVAGLFSPELGAQDDKQRCKESFEQAQLLRRDSLLIEARKEILACISSCPADVQDSCEEWLKQVDRMSPPQAPLESFAAGPTGILIAGSF